MIAFLKILDKVTNKIQEYILMITCVAVTALIIIAALMRYIFKVDFYGSEELILFIAFWLYFVGSINSSRDDTHINADMVTLFTSNQKILRAVKIFRTLLCIAITAVATKWSFDYVSWTFLTGGRSNVFKLPTIIAQFPIFLSYVCWLIYLIRDAVLLFTTNKKGDQTKC